MLLRTARLLIERITPTDAARIVAGAGTTHDRWHPEYPLADELDPLRFLAADPDPDPLFTMYRIRRTDDGLAIGGLGFFGPPDDDGAVEIGYGLVPAARGHGLATEAVRAAVRSAVDHGAGVVRADTDTDNLPSQAVLLRSGFFEVGRDEQSVHFAWRATEVLPPPQARATMIRPARVSDLVDLQDIERAAGEQFRGIGMDAVADDPPPTMDELTGYVDAGRAWVCADGNDRPVGYLALLVVDGEAHIEQVSVHPNSARRRIGQSLVEHAAAWAAEQRFSLVTLTAFTDVPWNGPYYRRLGFEEIPDDALGPELRRIRQHEAEHGLDRWPRAALRRRLRNETG